MRKTLTQQEYDTVKEILGRSGFNTDRYKDVFLKRRIEFAISRSGVTSLQEFITRLEQDHLERKQLEQFFSINVTRFFRNYDTYELLDKHYFPQLIARKRREQKNFSIYVWSVGCANGAEPYTLAILFSKLLGEDAPFRVRITGTDYNPDSLTFAKKGIYPVASLQEVPDLFRERYFTEHSPGHFQVDRQIRRMVQFHFHDLLKNPTISPQQDIIVCRNVLIYFSLESQERIYRELTRALKPHGLLILGRTEILHHNQWGLPFTRSHAKHRIYQKTDG